MISIKKKNIIFKEDVMGKKRMMFVSAISLQIEDEQEIM
jgi:hypothetical protein